MPEKSKFKTSVGGQAVMEGIMMRGPAKWCLAVRVPNGEIVSEVHDTKPNKVIKIPVIRGIAAFIDSLLTGYKTIMRSAELAMGEDFEEEEPSKFDLWLDKHFGEIGTKIIMGISAIFGGMLAMVLFMVLPTAGVGFLDKFVPLGGWKTPLEGILKITLFVLYLAAIRQMKEIKRVFKYHGAEHKTISCYESGEELTVENIRKHSRFHPRCGTSFMLIVLVISIALFSVLPWSGTLNRVILKLVMLPAVMGLAYEVIRFAGKFDNPVTRIISAPGMWMQRLTTSEPDDSMLEVAIAAVTPVLPEKPDEAKW